MPTTLELPGFRILALLGRGGMGAVYLADDLALGRKVAIKVLAEKFHGDKEARDRFLREARALAGIDHPNVLRIHSLGESQGAAFIVMEYVEGESLARRISAGPMTADEVLRIARQAAAGLNAAWEKGIVHRDVKPSNLLVDSAGQVRVADFGLAKPVQVDASFNTATGIVLGTPHYISPEQARGEPVDLRSDIYSLGVALYEMATGKRPFAGATPVEVVAHHLHSPMPTLPSSTGKSAPHLGRVILKMTEKRPADRPGSYQELSALLQGTPSPHAYRRRYQRLAIPALGASLILGGIVSVRVWQGRKADAVIYDEAKVDVPPARISGRFDSGFGVLAPGTTREEGCLGAISVVLKFVITESGEVVGITADDPKLAGEAILSLSQRKYSPAQVRGRPVRVRSSARFTNPSEFKTLTEFQSQALMIEQSRMPLSQTVACLDELARQLKTGSPEFRAEARRALVGMARAYPLEGSDRTTIGKILTDALESASAGQVLEIALARIPEKGREYERIADGFVAAGDLERALKAYQLAVLVDPSLEGARNKVRALKPGTTAAPEETYNGAKVYQEADLEKGPTLVSRFFQRPTLEPGRVVSVNVAWIVTPEGLVHEPRVLASSSPELDTFIVDVVRKWRYEPGQKDGKPVPVRVVRRYAFGRRDLPPPSPSATPGKPHSS